MPGKSKGRFNTNTEIYPDDLCRSPFSSEFCMAALTASTLNEHLILKELFADRLQPTEELIGILYVLLSEVRPLPAKVLRSCCLVLFDLSKVDKPGNTADDLILASTFLTGQYAVDDLFIVVLTRIRQYDVTPACRAGQ